MATQENSPRGRGRPRDEAARRRILKAALDLLGYHGGKPRPPLLPLTAEQRLQVRDALAGAGLLAAMDR